jgi:ketosteroid isomerase-like protein
MTDTRIALARDLFAAWSSGDADAPQPYLHADAVLYDAVSGEFVGWPAIRAFFARGVEAWPDLVLAPLEYWTNDDGVALSWLMSATVTPAMGARMGEQYVGRRWQSEGMSRLRIVDGLVVHEVDYHDAASRMRSLSS